MAKLSEKIEHRQFLCRLAKARLRYSSATDRAAGTEPRPDTRRSTRDHRPARRQP